MFVCLFYFWYNSYKLRGYFVWLLFFKICERLFFDIKCGVLWLLFVVHFRKYAFSCWVRCSIGINLTKLFDNVLLVIYNLLHIIGILHMYSPITEKRVLKFPTMVLNFSFFFSNVLSFPSICHKSDVRWMHIWDCYNFLNNWPDIII